MDTLLALIVGFVLGILFVLWDNKKGYVWYKRWYDLSHKEPLKQMNHYSFINNQPFSKRVVPAILITASFTLITYLMGSLNPAYALLTGGISLVGVIVGFYIGPFVANKLPKGLQKATETLEKIDKLEAELKAEKKTEEITEKPETEEPKSDDEKKDDDWRKGIKDFIDK